MPRAGPKKVHRYSLEFKLKAVRLSQLKGIEVQALWDRIGATAAPTASPLATRWRGSCWVLRSPGWPYSSAPPTSAFHR